MSSYVKAIGQDRIPLHANLRNGRGLDGPCLLQSGRTIIVVQGVHAQAFGNIVMVVGRTSRGRIGGSVQATKTRLLQAGRFRGQAIFAWTVGLEYGIIRQPYLGNLCRFCFPRYSLKRGVG